MIVIILNLREPLLLCAEALCEIILLNYNIVLVLFLIIMRDLYKFSNLSSYLKT